MSSEPADVAVHALIQDMIPLLLPRARFDADACEVVLPVGRAELRAVTATIVGRCARTPQHEWPRLVEEWLLSVSDQASLAVGEIELLRDVRKRLRFRVVPRIPDARRADYVLTELGPFFDAQVVIDHPRYFGPLTTERASRLHLDHLGSAIDLTLERELVGVTVTERPLTLTENVRFVTKPGSRYVSAALADLTRFLPRRCPYGVLVGVPDHNRLMLYVPPSAAARAGIAPEFAEVVAEMYDAGDDPCSRHVFWWFHGDIRPVRVGDGLPPELDEFAVRFRPRGTHGGRAVRTIAAGVGAALRRLR